MLTKVTIGQPQHADVGGVEALGLASVILDPHHSGILPSVVTTQILEILEYILLSGLRMRNW